MSCQLYKLRAYHGSRLWFFPGKGLQPGLRGEHDPYKAALEENAAVCRNVSGDVICATCPNDRSGVCTTVEKVARYDREVLDRCGLAVGQTLPYRKFQASVYQNILLAGQREAVCGDCYWSQLCRWEAVSYDHEGKIVGAAGIQ